MILNKNNFYKHRYNFHVENEQVMTFLNPSLFQWLSCIYIFRMFQTWMIKLRRLNLHVRMREKYYVKLVRKRLVTELKANIYLWNRLVAHFAAKQMEGRLCVYFIFNVLMCILTTLNYPSFIVASYIKIPRIFINEKNACYVFFFLVNVYAV